MAANVQSLSSELNRLKEANEANLTLISQRENDVRSSQQNVSRLKSELDILKLREEDSRLMTEQLQSQLSQTFGQLKVKSKARLKISFFLIFRFFLEFTHFRFYVGNSFL